MRGVPVAEAVGVSMQAHVTEGVGLWVTHAHIRQVPPRDVQVIVSFARQVLIDCGVHVGVAVGVPGGVCVVGAGECGQPGIGLLPGVQVGVRVRV